jgi:exopolyphosphatase/guanosine-5'-triphosphate,3'-diphosphate pyrophosphatase
VTEAHWDQMKDFLKKEMRTMVKHLTAIGSGGNINKVFSLSKERTANRFPLNYLKIIIKNSTVFQ